MGDDAYARQIGNCVADCRIDASRDRESFV